MAGSSNVFDVSSLREDLKLMQASNVNVSNFVSEKLSGARNYHIWQTQMICLMQSQQLLHIIGDNCIFPRDFPYDGLVKGWILGSLKEKVLKDMVDLKTARDIWRELESLFKQPIKLPLKLDTWELGSMYFYNRGDYKTWKDEMYSLIETKKLLPIIDAEFTVPLDKYHEYMFPLYDKLVKNWIDCTISPKLRLENFVERDSALYVWMKLESFFDSTKGVAGREDLKYIQALNFSVSNLVTVKLSGHSNYKIWKAQILGLLRIQGLLHIISAEYPVLWNMDVPMIVQYDELVKSWILSSVTEKVLKDLLDSITARGVWGKLDSLFTLQERDHYTEGPARLMFGIESVGDVPEIENKDSHSRRKILYDAAVEGCWWKAKSILKIHKNAATEPITPNGNTILHIAVEMGQNYFVEKLLEFLKDENEIGTKNENGQTALHIAAMVGNEYATQLLVQKWKEVLEIRCGDEESPLDIISYINFDSTKLNILACLLKCAISFSPDGRRNSSKAIHVAMLTKQYDLARTLLEKNPDDAFDPDILLAITLTFPTDLSYTESFIYPSFKNGRQKIFVRGSLLFHDNFLDKCVDDILWVVKICNNMCCSSLGNISMILLVPIATLYPIYRLIHLLTVVLHLAFSMLYLLLWKVLVVTAVQPIKNIEKKKKEYEEANATLRLICNQMGKDNSGYTYVVFEAIRKGTHEVVDEILFMSPKIINFKNEEGHNIIQSAIINRSEKVYNLIHHIIDRTKSYRTMKDSYRNNLAHLAGRLAPSFVLDRTTGAALQLQGELQWREEVKKLMSPKELTHMNIDDETPAMVFTREHADLLKKGENWMKTTAESCSITAALIVTIVFAAAITVPGGSNQESGIPLFKKEFAFTIFAVFNAFSLFTAATSLLLFLSILTTRFSEKDFLVSLPRRLILGLMTLFLSTTAMIVAFGAILFLVFCDQRPWMLAPICGFVCLPISVIVMVKVPLLVDLIQSTYLPIFGKQSYLDSCKINRRNTIIMDTQGDNEEQFRL